VVERRHDWMRVISCSGDARNIIRLYMVLSSDPLGMDDLWTDVRAMSPLGKHLIVHLRNTSALRLRMDGPCPISEASDGVSWR